MEKKRRLCGLNLQETENQYKVYKHTTPSGKIYIGITSQETDKRWQNGYGYAGNGYFMREIKKYGWDNIKHEILFAGLSKSEAEKKEIELISLYNSANRDYGYNISNGGNSTGKHSEETKDKMRETAKAHNFSDRLHTKEVVNKRAISQRGHEVSEETRKKIGQANINTKRSDVKRVIQFDLSGNKIKVWNRIMDVQRALGYSNTAISRCCRGGRPTAYGYVWRYADE